jgi:hypothetical protein
MKKINKIVFKKRYDEGIRPEDVYDSSLLTPEIQRSWELDEWWFEYVYAEAEIEINGNRQKIKSGGLGAVESNAPKDYLDEIKTEEFDDLKDILSEIGFIGKYTYEAMIEECRSKYMAGLEE